MHKIIFLSSLAVIPFSVLMVQYLSCDGLLVMDMIWFSCR